MGIHKEQKIMCGGFRGRTTLENAYKDPDILSNRWQVLNEIDLSSTTVSCFHLHCLVFRSSFIPDIFTKIDLEINDLHSVDR